MSIMVSAAAVATATPTAALENTAGDPVLATRLIATDEVFSAAMLDVISARDALDEWNTANPAPELGGWPDGDGKAEEAGNHAYRAARTVHMQRSVAFVRSLGIAKKQRAFDEARALHREACMGVARFRARSLAELIWKANLTASDGLEHEIALSIVEDLYDLGEAEAPCFAFR